MAQELSGSDPLAGSLVYALRKGRSHQSQSPDANGRPTRAHGVAGALLDVLDPDVDGSAAVGIDPPPSLKPVGVSQVQSTPKDWSHVKSSS